MHVLFAHSRGPYFLLLLRLSFLPISVEKSKKSAESARMMQQSELEALQNTDLFKRLNAKTKVGTHM